MTMKIIQTKKNTQSAKKQVTEAFGKKLPAGYTWTSSKRRSGHQGQVITWTLSDKKSNVIAKVTNNGKIRKIHLDRTVFKIGEKKTKKKATTTTTTTKSTVKKTVKKNPKRRGKKKPVQFPPPFRPSGALLDKLVEKYSVHENPDPPDCENCGMKYRDLRTGLDFKAVQDMLFVSTPDPNQWRQKGRHSVLGLWFEIKRNMWDDHISMCEDQEAQAQWFEDFEPADFEAY